MYNWKSGHTPGGHEWYNYPSPLAQRHLPHVIGIGRAITHSGYQHKHANEDGFLLHLMQRGRMWIRSRSGTVHRADAGTVYLMDMSEPFEYGNDGRADVQTEWFVCNGKDVPALFAELRADRDPVFRNLHHQRIGALFTELQSLIRRQPPGCEPKCASVILAIFGELFASRAQRGEMVDLADRAPVLSVPVRRGIDYITRFYHDRLQLKRLADRVELSMFHFARLFRKETGMTPIEYLNRHRIAHAKRLLQHSSKPMAQIGVMVGVPDATYFARLFRRYEGTTPLRFRRLSRQQGSTPVVDQQTPSSLSS